MRQKMTATYTIAGDPVAWKRAQRKGNRYFDAQKELKDDYFYELLCQRKMLPILKGPLNIRLEFHMPIPQSWSKTKQQAVAYQPHYNKPDLDNMIKFFCDAAIGVLYDDDKQIATLFASKIYSPSPKTVIQITDLDSYGR